MNQPSPPVNPPSQNTALVLEFRCLYTHDVRRKAQKRWHDGKIRFHTFNRRVMVYDETFNFISDVHWQERGEFGEGELLRLDRGGIEVEVQECIGKKEQDLTELLDKRAKDRKERVAAKAAPTRPQAQFVGVIPTPSGELMKPRPLNAVIGTPTGHYGRAMIPNVSPFEQKQQRSRGENISDRPVKRQKRESMVTSGGYAQSLMGASLSLGSQKPAGTATIRYEPFRSSIQRPQIHLSDATENQEGLFGNLRNGISATAHEKVAIAIPKKKIHRSPPPRSSYASGLTGATLNLGPSRSIVRNPRDILLTEQDSSPVESGMLKRHNTAAVEATAVVHSERAKHLSTTSDKIPQKRGKISPPSRSDSPAAKESSSTLASSFGPNTGLQADKPTSKLKIRSREPRTLMMASKHPRPTSKPSTLPTMSRDTTSIPRQPRPLSKSSSPIRSNDHDIDISATVVKQPVNKTMSTLRIKPRPPQKMMMLMGRPVGSSHSPATTCESYESDNSNTGKKPHAARSQDTYKDHSDRISNSSFPTIDSKVEVSSPLDSGIDHLTIDTLLFPARAQNELLCTTSKGQSPWQNEPQAQQSVINSATATHFGRNPFISSPRTKVYENEMDTFYNSLQVNSKLGKPVGRTNNGTSQILAPIPTDNVELFKPVVATDRGCSAVKVALSSAQVTPPGPMVNLSKATSPQISKILPAQERRVDRVPPTNSKKQVATVTGLIQRNGSSIQQSECGVHPEAEKNSGTITSIYEPPDKSTLEVEQAKQIPPTGKIANPATRGQSIQLTVNNTVNMLTRNDIVWQKDMLPPPALTSMSNSRRTLSKGPAVLDKPVASTTTAGGPWSQESFDLFGTWRPPREGVAKIL